MEAVNRYKVVHRFLYVTPASCRLLTGKAGVLARIIYSIPEKQLKFL